MAKNKRLRDAILETASDLHGSGLMSTEKYQKITHRMAGSDFVPSPAPISADEIRAVREHAHLSQAVFARCLNVSTGYVSQLERGIRQPSGPALALLDLMRRKGVEALR